MATSEEEEESIHVHFTILFILTGLAVAMYLVIKILLKSRPDINMCQHLLMIFSLTIVIGINLVLFFTTVEYTIDYFWFNNRRIVVYIVVNLFAVVIVLMILFFILLIVSWKNLNRRVLINKVNVYTQSQIRKMLKLTLKYLNPNCFFSLSRWYRLSLRHRRISRQ